MKTKLFYALTLLAVTSLASCDKDKENNGPSPQPATSVKIGDKDYAIVKIGAQWWTAENYSGDGGVYYNNDVAFASFGKLYTVAEARAIQVPQGWRLPTKDDFKKLFEGQGVTFEENEEENNYVSTTGSTEAIKKLASATGWMLEQGTNSSTFNAKPAGGGYGTASFRETGMKAIF